MDSGLALGLIDAIAVIVDYFTGLRYWFSSLYCL